MAQQFEFRPVTRDELPGFRELLGYVFASTSAPDAAEDPLLPEWTHAAFHKGRVVASSGGFPFKLRMNGRGVNADGVTAVGTNPGYRRRGLVRRLITDLLHRAHDKGQETSILWASMGAIYQRFGYGQGSTQAGYSFDPRFVEFQFGGPPTGYTRLLEKDDAVPIISQLYRGYIEERNLMLHRAPVLWEIPFRSTENKTHCAVHFNDDDEADAYITYATKGMDTPDEAPGPDQEMMIEDFVWQDMNGYRGIWDFIRAHDLVGRVTWYRVPEDDPAPHMLLEPRVLRRRTSDGIWLRIVDAPATLAGRGYHRAGETTLEIAEDPECPWNVGKYRLTTDAVQAEVEPTSADAEIRITPHGLASLLAGHTSLSQLVQVGRADVDDPRRLAELDILFSTRYRPFCMNGF